MSLQLWSSPFFGIRWMIALGDHCLSEPVCSYTIGRVSLLMSVLISLCTPFTLGLSLSKSPWKDYHLLGTLDGFIFINNGPSSWKSLSQWTYNTKDDFRLEWPLGDSFEVPKLVFLHNKLESFRIKWIDF